MRLCLLTLTLACACATTPAASGSGSWDDAVNTFIEEWFKRHPEDAVQAGRHEFDGQVPDLSEAAFQEEIDWLKATADQMEPFPQSQEREYALSVVKRKLFWAET